jgi:hypothetical protein
MSEQRQKSILLSKKIAPEMSASKPTPQEVRTAFEEMKRAEEAYNGAVQKYQFLINRLAPEE